MLSHLQGNKSTFLIFQGIILPQFWSIWEYLCMRKDWDFPEACIALQCPSSKNVNTSANLSWIIITAQTIGTNNSLHFPPCIKGDYKLEWSVSWLSQRKHFQKEHWIQYLTYHRNWKRSFLFSFVQKFHCWIRGSENSYMAFLQGKINPRCRNL